MHVISHAEGQIWKWIKDPRLAISTSILSKRYCDHVAALKFEEALVSHPTSIASLRNAVLCRFEFWSPPKNYSKYQFVNTQFQVAQDLDPTDALTSVMFHEAKLAFNKIDEAEDILLDYLQNQPLDDLIKRTYVAFLNKYGPKEEQLEKKAHFLALRKHFKRKLRASAKT